MDKTLFKGVILALILIIVGVVALTIALDEPGGTPSANKTPTNTTTTTAPAVTTTEQVRPARIASAITVVVINTTDVDGAAGRLTDTLIELGYETGDAHNADPQTRSNIFYFSNWGIEARKVASDLGVSFADAQRLVAPLPVPFTLSEVGDAKIVIVLGGPDSFVPPPLETTTTVATTTTTAAS